MPSTEYSYMNLCDADVGDGDGAEAKTQLGSKGLT